MDQSSGRIQGRACARDVRRAGTSRGAIGNRDRTAASDGTSAHWCIRPPGLDLFKQRFINRRDRARGQEEGAGGGTSARSEEGGKACRCHVRLYGAERRRAQHRRGREAGAHQGRPRGWMGRGGEGRFDKECSSKLSAACMS